MMQSLHADYEALHSSNLLDKPTTQAFICVDNLAAIQTLADNKDNSEPAKMATQPAYSLKQKGWDIQTAWTPTHIGIKGSEKADEMAKSGAKGELDLCQHACATKAWWYTEARKRYPGRRRIEIRD
jgi:ribonuclease HI